ncbi:uncharacterized protein TNCV_1198121 [Trichonephila clavipes]|uniref:Uncharacterized protein n=1 Tax=Trichonephila clavipes TaxID=2585209 RepID=A0A8X6RZG3_TRICX|nr:uncharacterized protein TNCV_1198121 [Trichonephila clavipes]
MAPHTITPAVGTVCRCKAKAGLRRSPLGLLSNTIDITAEIESQAAVQFPRTRHHSKRKRRGVDVKSSTRNGCRDTKCPLARHRIVREDAGSPSEGAACAWKADDEAVSCMLAFLTMWRSSPRLVC